MTIDFAELNRQRERNKAFRATELGKLFYDYQAACINYWRNDANDNISDRRLSELDERCKAAERALVNKLMDLAQ